MGHRPAIVEDLVQLLPTPEEQTWLINELVGLVRGCGPDQFVSMPVVEPTSRYFPDPWSFSLEGVDRVVRRLMQYASLAELEVFLGTFSDPGHPMKDELQGRSGVAGVFLGLENESAYFAFNEVAPADGDYIAGVMAHEVAHAYRARHGLRSEDPNQEEWLTDLTATYLGFGILVANNSYRYRTSGHQMGIYGVLTTSTHRVGYLSPQAFGFLLAMQVEARALDEGEEKGLLRHLETNQGACVRAALDLIRADPEGTVERLGLPATLSPTTPLDDILRPLPDVVAVQFAPQQPDPGFNAGRPVFRVPQSRLLGYSGVGILAGAFLGALVMIFLKAGWALALIAILGTGVGLYLGNRVRFDRCSDPDCDSVIPDGMAVCPGCGGSVAGTIRHASERLAAEEALEEKKRKRGRPMKRRRQHPRA